MILQDLEWIQVDAEIALHNDTILFYPPLNIFCPHFQALIESLGSQLLDPFVIISLHLNVNEAEITSSKL